MKKVFQRGRTLSVKALRLCQLPPRGSLWQDHRKQLLKAGAVLAPPLGELSSVARLRGLARVPTPFFLRFCYPINTRKKVPPIKTVIYLDVLLLTNFALTLLFLLAAGLLAGVECRAGRLLLGGAAGAASSLALLAPEAPDAAALLYKVSTAALTVAAAYGWPGVRCFARLVGWFCAGNLLLAGTLLLPGAQTNNGCIYLPLSPGALLAGAGGVVLVRFGAVQGRLPPALGTYLEQHFAGAAPLPVPALGVRLVPCTTVAGHCILPAVPASLCRTGSPAGQGRAEHLYAAFADLPPPPDGWEVLVGVEAGEMIHPLRHRQA